PHLPRGARDELRGRGGTAALRDRGGRGLTSPGRRRQRASAPAAARIATTMITAAVTAAAMTMPATAPALSLRDLDGAGSSVASVSDVDSVMHPPLHFLLSLGGASPRRGRRDAHTLTSHMGDCHHDGRESRRALA